MDGAEVAVEWMDGAEVAVEWMVYDEATALPGHRVFASAVHPGLEAGAALALSAGTSTRLDARGHLGVFDHGNLAVGTTIDAGLAVEHVFDFGGVVGSELSVGALWSRNPEGEYVQDDAGAWSFRRDTGRVAMRTGLAAELGWRLGTSRGAARLLLRYRSWVEAPFAPGFIPVMVHGDTGLALRVPLAPGRW